MIKVLDLKFLDVNQTVAAFLVETTEGPILFETGPYSTFEQLKIELARYKYKPEDIKQVMLTHIHLDHAGAAWAFAKMGAQIHVHPFGMSHLADPSRLMESARRIYKENMDRLWGDMQAIPKTQLKMPQHGVTFKIGEHQITPWYTPGHAVHHIAWQVNDELIAGDVAGVSIGKNIVVPPCPPPDINIEHWQESIQLIKGLDIKTIYLTHYGAVTDIDNHLDALEKILLDWANWMRPYWEAGKHPKEVTPLFEAYVKQQLMAAGIKGEGLKQYEIANPSWTSVAGLMRYWRKKEEV